MAFAKTGIGFFDGLDMRSGQLDFLFQGLFFEFEQTLIPGSKAVLDEDLLDGRAGDQNSYQFELVAQPDASPHGIGQRECQDFFTTSGGVVWGWNLWIGGRSLRPSSPWAWKRRLYS